MKQSRRVSVQACAHDGKEIDGDGGHGRCRHHKKGLPRSAVGV
jgi:hypothetical protein